MGVFKQARANSMASDAKRSYDEGHTIFVAQFRGPFSHSPSMSRPIPGVAEMMESVEAQGWELDQFNSVPYKDNMTVVGLFKRKKNK